MSLLQRLIALNGIGNSSGVIEVIRGIEVDGRATVHIHGDHILTIVLQYDLLLTTANGLFLPVQMRENGTTATASSLHVHRGANRGNRRAVMLDSLQKLFLKDRQVHGTTDNLDIIDSAITTDFMNAGDGKLVESLDEVIASSTESIKLFLADAALHVLTFIHTWHRELYITLGVGREGHLHLLALD